MGKIKLKSVGFLDRPVSELIQGLKEIREWPSLRIIEARVNAFEEGGTVEGLINAVCEWNHQTREIAPSDKIWVYVAELQALLPKKEEKK